MSQTREDRYEHLLRAITERLKTWCECEAGSEEEEGFIEMVCDIREQIDGELFKTHEERCGVQRS